jgi:hypothetical protein
VKREKETLRIEMILARVIDDAKVAAARRGRVRHHTIDSARLKIVVRTRVDANHEPCPR